MEVVGLGLAWEEMTVGRTFRTVGRTVSETDLMNFISCTGMTETLFTVAPAEGKPRLVPAALIYGLAEGLLIQAVLQGVGVAFLNMEVDVQNPTHVGDTLHVECEVIEARASKGRPGHGLVRTRNSVVKADGTVVMVYTPLRLLRGRDGLAEAAACKQGHAGVE